jgi:Endonuclease NucS
MQDFMYKYEKRYKYPHLAPNDVAIWEKFIDTYPTRYSTVDYDFALGGVPLSAQIFNSPIGNEMVRIYQRRIDVLAQSGNETHIIEVKPRAGLSALGQVKGYAELYLQYVDPTAKVVPILVTDSHEPDMRMLADKMGVLLFIV